MLSCRYRVQAASHGRCHPDRLVTGTAGAGVVVLVVLVVVGVGLVTGALQSGSHLQIKHGTRTIGDYGICV